MYCSLTVLRMIYCFCFPVPFYDTILILHIILYCLRAETIRTENYLATIFIIDFLFKVFFKG